MSNSPVLYGIGVGPGASDLMTLRALRTIESCEVLAVPRTHKGNMFALEIVRGECDLDEKTILPIDFTMSRDEEVLSRAHDAAAELILEQLRAGRSVAFITLGDVSIYSTFTPLSDRVQAAGFQTAMIPGVPSFCAIAAELGMDLTPEMNDALHIIPSANDKLGEVVDLPGTKVIMKASKRMDDVKELLHERGMFDRAQAIQNCGMKDQNIARSLDDVLPDQYFTTVLVLP